MSQIDEYRPNTLRFRQCIARMKSTGHSMMWLAQRIGVHHQTLAAWHCDQRRIPEARLHEIERLVAALK